MHLQYVQMMYLMFGLDLIGASSMHSSQGLQPF